MSVHTEVDYTEVQRMHVIAYRIMVVLFSQKESFVTVNFFFFYSNISIIFFLYIFLSSLSRNMRFLENACVYECVCVCVCVYVCVCVCVCVYVINLCAA